MLALLCCPFLRKVLTELRGKEWKGRGKKYLFIGKERNMFPAISVRRSGVVVSVVWDAEP